MSATLTTAALRADHIRTLKGRACPCCVRIHGGKDTRRIRRSQRRREAAAWRREADAS